MKKSNKPEINSEELLKDFDKVMKAAIVSYYDDGYEEEDYDDYNSDWE